MKPRRVERVRAFLGAQILFNNHNSTIDCQIRNISPAGAKILVTPTVTVPEEFELNVPQKGRTFRCRLRWRIGDAAGVEFMDFASPETMAERNRVLEAENEALRRQVHELTRCLRETESRGAA